MEQQFDSAFASVRPPRHHASKFYGLGLCIFNVTIAAQNLLQSLGLERVLILDIEAHHGNGTQEVVYGTEGL